MIEDRVNVAVPPHDIVYEMSGDKEQCSQVEPLSDDRLKVACSTRSKTIGKVFM
jgi:hypothetical protein